MKSLHLVPLKLTEEEYREIFIYTERVLPPEWIDKNEVKDPTDPAHWGNKPEDGMNPNFIGMLGECALNKEEGKPVSQTLADRPQRESDAGFDIIIDDVKFDIKVLRSLKGYRPLLKWRYDISKHLIDQQKDCDAYFWISMVKCTDIIAMPWYWLAVGWLTREEFLKNAKFNKKGDKSIAGNGFEFKSPAYDIEVRKMHPYIPKSKRISDYLSDPTRKATTALSSFM